MKVALEIILKVCIILKSVAKRANTDTHPNGRCQTRTALNCHNAANVNSLLCIVGPSIHKIFARSIFTQNYLRWTKRLSFEKGPSQAQ